MHKNKSIIVKISIIILLSLVSLVSCTSSKQEFKIKTCTNLNPVYITNSKKVYLLSSIYNSQIIDSLQLLNGNYGPTDFSLLIYTQIDSRGINLSMMNEFGADMGNLSFNDKQIIFDSSYFPSQLSGEYIICDIQNAFYDTSILTQHYANSKLNFEAFLIDYETGGPVEIRKISDGNNLIEKITIENKLITIENFLRNYSYVLYFE